MIMKIKQKSQDFSATKEQENNRDGRSVDEEEQDLLNLHEQGDTPMISYIGNFDRVCGSEDLEPRKGMSINPPPSDGKCMCCGRHLEELSPFGGPDDPLVGDFAGALLIKKYRRCGPYDEEAEIAYAEAAEKYVEDGLESPMDWLVRKYGKEKGERLNFAVEFHEQISSSWECRDCVVLDNDEYFEKLGERYTS
jgi:hypothetical protein